jgi:hypothetical protein
MTFTGHENHDISLDDASELTKNYRDFQTSTNYVKGEFFGKTALLALLNQEGSVGARIYYGLGADGVPRLVIVGVNSDGDDMVDGNIMEHGTICPPICSESNQLNN